MNSIALVVPREAQYVGPLGGGFPDDWMLTV
jgi:hypothetical protein